jgi:hypothetical protein
MQSGGPLNVTLATTPRFPRGFSLALDLAGSGGM